MKKLDDTINLARFVEKTDDDARTLSQETLMMEQNNKKVNSCHEKRYLDPTRYGDWEKNGRCIEFWI